MSVFTQELRAGWRNLLAATVGIGLGIASYFPLQSIFFLALEKEFGWSKAVAAASLIALPVTALLLPLAGWIIDRVGVRIASGFSVVACTLSYVWLSRLSGNVPEYYAVIIALNVLGCATGPVAYTRLVAAQFREARGTALGIAQFGNAFMAVLLPPLLGAMMINFGWRGSYIFLAAVALLGGIIAQIFMRPVDGGSVDESATGATPTAAVKSGAFWILALAIFSISVAVFGFVTQFQAILVERGVDARTALLMLSILGISVMFTRLIVGRLLDLKNPYAWAAGVVLVAAAGLIILLANPSNLPLIIVALVLLGFGIGAELDFMSFFCARHFGVRHYSAIYGMLSIAFYIGIAVGGISYGVIRDRTGSYDLAMIVAIVLVVLAAAMFTILRRAAPVRTSA